MVSAEDVADHVVISEVNITGDPEWVELYNPTSMSVDLNDTYLCYYSPGRDWNNSFKPSASKKQLSGTIPAYGFYLVKIDGMDGVIPTPDCDWGYDAPASALSDSTGSIGIFPWDPDTKTADEANNGRIDAVAWGAVDHVKEGDEASVPTSGKTLQRKVNATINESTVYGPAWDSDDNSADFFIQDSPTPTNSTTSSANPVAPIPEPLTIILVSTGLLMLAGYAYMDLRNR